MARTFGHSWPRALASRSAVDLYSGSADRRKFIARLRKMEVLRNCELRLRRNDGSPLHILENVGLVPDERGRRRTIQGTMVDISDLKRIQESLKESGERHRVLATNLRRLTHHPQTVREEERRRIARELHDELGQIPTALKLDLHWTVSRIPTDAMAARGRFASTCRILDRTIETVRTICSDLRPALLDHAA